MNQIKVENVSFGYTSEKVIDNISLDVENGQIISIEGENGSGKSTLLKLILNELKPDSGQIKIFGKDTTETSDYSRVGYVPQMQKGNQIAFPTTVLEIVCGAMYKDFGFFKIPNKSHKKKATEILTKMGFANYINKPFNELSGGLQQRTIIARSIISNAELLLLDEPTIGVDKESKIKLMQTLEELNKNNGLTIVMVTHEIDFIKDNLSIDRSYKMQEGRLIDA